MIFLKKLKNLKEQKVNQNYRTEKNIIKKKLQKILKKIGSDFVLHEKN